MAKNLTTRDEDYSKWYNELVIKADLAENSGVRGCMVIKPYGFAIWEMMQAELDRMFKETGHQNAYFPLFIPKSYFSKEASHVDGLAKECAVVHTTGLKLQMMEVLWLMKQQSLKKSLLCVQPLKQLFGTPTENGFSLTEIYHF